MQIKEISQKNVYEDICVDQKDEMSERWVKEKRMRIFMNTNEKDKFEEIYIRV